VTLFIVLAALMAVGALALVIAPLLRGPEGERRATVSAVVAALALPVLAGFLYLQWSTWPWNAGSTPPGVAPEVLAMVDRLSARLARNGGTLEEWQMLGRSRAQLGQYDLAAEAFREAYRISGGSDITTLTSYAEALALSDPEALLADAGDLFERALAMDPTDGKSLWYGGLAAFGRGDYALARDRWRGLVDRDPPPPDDVRQILEERIAVAEAQLGAAGGAAPSPATPASGSADAADGATAAARRVVVDVSVAPALAGRVAADAPLFVLARAPGEAGPPLAVERRRADELPLRVELTEEDAMVPGRTIAGPERLEIVARVALGGDPMARPGDLYGSVEVAADGDAPIRVEIDRVQQ
jgi:cytochrome c-type biogenesis protein CcmH